jgi:hypothetical protein
MATRKFLFLDATDGFVTESDPTDDTLLGGLAMTGDIAMGTSAITGMADPAAAQDAATKAYVDSVATGLDVKASVRMATAAALPANTSSGTAGEGHTLTANANGSLVVDGLTTALNDRILVKTEAAGSDNGIYTLTQVGVPATTPWVLTRATDADTDAEVNAGMFTFSTEGTANADIGWVLTTDNPIVVDTTALVFSQFSTATTLTGGDGIDITGTVVSVDLATNPGLQFTGTELDVLLDGTTLQKGAGGLSVLGLPSLFEVNSVAVGATVTAPNFDTLTDLSNADALHTHTTVDAVRVAESLIVGTGVTAGDPVEWGQAVDRIQPCDASVTALVDAMGVAETTATAGNPATVVRLGIAVGVLSGATFGNRYFLDTGGGLIQGSGTLGSGDHIVFMGTAVNATDLEVKPQYFGRKN